MKTFVILFISIIAFSVQNLSALLKTVLEPLVTSVNPISRNLSILENGFPPMEIKVYNGASSNEGPFYSNSDYMFIVQPVASITGFEENRFDFKWFINYEPAATLEGAGIQLATLLLNAKNPGQYKLTVQLWDGGGHTTVVERIIEVR